MAKYKFSILVITYNPVWSKLKLTIDSVMKQDFTDYEIVVTDDGSTDNCHDRLRKYFEQMQFDRFTLVENKENQGTVKNLLSGLEKCQGEYIRDFGPGDLFYSKETLGRLCRFMDEKNCDICGGYPRGFAVDEKGIIDKPYYNPFDINPYKQENTKRIKKNLVLYSDTFSGANLAFKKDFFVEYLGKIKDKVIYCEDLIQIMSAIDGKEVCLFDDYMVWYELGTGTSTKKKSRFSKLLAVDVDNFFKFLNQTYPNDKLIKKRMKLQKYYKINNLYIRTLSRVFENPGLIIYMLRHYIQIINGAFKPRSKSLGFLEDKSFLKEERKYL